MTDEEIRGLTAERDALREEADWVRKKLDLPADTPLFAGAGKTLAGTLHVLCSHAHGYETYIAAHKCNDKQGEIARLTVEIDRLRADYAGGDMEAQALSWVAVYRECERLGILADTWGDTTRTGQGRVIAFLRHLAARAGVRLERPPAQG